MIIDGEEYPEPDLDALAALLPNFEAAGFWFGRVESEKVRTPDGEETTLIQERLSDDAHRFVSAVHGGGWMVPFNYLKWGRSEECHRLHNDREALEQATVEQLVKMLTAIMRVDRFATGSLAESAKSGLLTGILRRVEQLRAEAAGERADG